MLDVQRRVFGRGCFFIPLLQRVWESVAVRSPSDKPFCDVFLQTIILFLQLPLLNVVVQLRIVG